MGLQMMILIALSVMIVTTIAYLVLFKELEQDYDSNSQGNHHDH